MDTFTVISKDYPDSIHFTYQAVIITEENAQELYEAVLKEEGMEDIFLETEPVSMGFRNKCGEHTGKVGQVLMLPVKGCWFIWDMETVKKHYDVEDG